MLSSRFTLGRAPRATGIGRIKLLDQATSWPLDSSSGLTVDAERHPKPEPLIGALLRLPLEAARDRLLNGLHDAGFTDLIPAHLNVLQYPGPDNRRPSELAAESRVTKQAMNYLLGQMEQLGYLVRTEDPADHRSKRVHLTERGRAAWRTTRETVEQLETEWAEQLGSKRFAHLRELLKELNETVGVASTRTRPR
jgi:DNA-binding MarR family transcriptional regulator